MKSLIIILFLTAVVGCSKSPEEIVYGFDSCSYCRMLITDSKYGSELVTQKGKNHKFDSIECLAAFQHSMEPSEIHSMWVTNFMSPNNLLEVSEAFYLRSENLRSPMGLNLSSFEDEHNRKTILKEYGGEIILWEDLVNYVDRNWN